MPVKPADCRPEDLLQALARGDQTAFARLFQATSAQLFGVAVRILRRRDWAEEVLQEAYLTIWDRAADYRPARGSAMGWMRTIVRNRAIDRHRAERKTGPLDDEATADRQEDPGPGPLDWASASEDARRLKSCLEELADEQRRCILMAICEGYTHHELAQRLGAPLGTVKSWIRRGLARLKDCLER